LLGQDPLDDVLPALGDNWACFFVPREASRPDRFPADALLAVELPAGESSPEPGERPALRAALVNALNTGLNYLTARRNRKSKSTAAVVRQKELGRTSIRWIERFGDFEPACALAPDALAISTSPAVIERFISPPKDESLTASPLYRHVSERYLSDESQLLFVNVAAVRNSLSQASPTAAPESPKPASAASSDGARYERDSAVRDVLELFDAAFVAGRVEENRVRLVAGAVLAPAN
jgi:hypothetical protein